MTSAAELVAGYPSMVIWKLILGVIGLVTLAIVSLGSSPKAGHVRSLLAFVACVLVFVGVYLQRLSFYDMYLTA